MPFDSPIVYFTPPFWAKQVFLQIVVMGHGLGENLYSSSLIGSSAEVIPISLLGGLLIVIAYTIVFIIIGIIIFQKKTKF
jgi:ABC-type transport system involved in multi-copper enzyme maturation permease subunit